MKIFIICCIVMCSSFGFTQDLMWTGNTSNEDFFDENNWVNSATSSAPVAGTLEPDTPINLDLSIQDAEDITANGIINLGTGSMVLQNVELSAHALSHGNVQIEEDTYLNLTSANPLLGSVEINFSTSLSWLKTENLVPNQINSGHISKFKVEQLPANYQTNIRLDNFYENGSIIRPLDLGNPLTIFSDENFSGNSSVVGIGQVYSSTNIPGGLNNSINSFQLKKGYMVTFAVNDDGTGKSKNYIASEEDLEIEELPVYLRNDISFIRVLPWNWVSKKGRSGVDTSDLDNTWFYFWSNNGDSTLDLEYAPMSWGAGGADEDSDIVLYQNKYKATHVMGFNESDNCNDQSGQYNNLCQVDVAVGYYENLMKTGMRLLSPSGRENAPFGWLKDFYDRANQEDVRIDAIGVHWYDWGSNPSNSPNADPNAVFQRFVTYLQNVYDLYGLPIWITEFNANPNRTNAVNYQFMQLALPYLESLDYVERYVWFQPNSDVADYYDTSGNLTNIGTVYKDQVSTPSIPEASVSANNNLDNYLELLDPTGENLLINGFFETQNLTGWSGSNIAILNNAYEGESSGRIMANPGALYQDVEVEPNTIYDLSFYTKWFVNPNNAIEVKILNTDTDEIIASQLMGTSTSWNLVQMSFTTPIDVSSIRFLVEKGASPGWFIDNAVLHKVQTLSTIGVEQNSQISFYPNPNQGTLFFDSVNEIQSVKLFDVYGRLIVEETNFNSNSMNISSLKSGIYIIKIEDKTTKLLTKKLILK